MQQQILKIEDFLPGYEFHDNFGVLITWFKIVENGFQLGTYGGFILIENNESYKDIK